jgi:hypothetical protein
MNSTDIGLPKRTLSMEQILREKLTVPSVVTKISFYGNGKCITTFTKARYISLSWPDQASPFFIPILVVTF